MELSSHKIDQAWKFSLAAVVIMCSEIFLPRDTAVVYEKDAANSYDYTGADEVNSDKLVSDEKKEFNPDMPPPVDGTP
jgi:hypothetical protein